MTSAETIVREHGARIRSLLATFNITPAEREDVFSRVSLQLVEKAHTFEGRSAVTTWLHRVTTNAVLELVRKASYKREQGGHDEEGLERASSLGHVHEPSPESRLNRAEQLHRSFEHLKAADRELLTLHYLDGMPLKDIADKLGMPEPLVRSRLFHARKKARDSYEGIVREPYAHNKNRTKRVP